MSELKRVVTLAPYNILVAFNEIKTDDTVYWFTDDEPEALKDWEFKQRF